MARSPYAKDTSTTSKETTPLATQRKRGRPPAEQTQLKNAMLDMFVAGFNDHVEAKIDDVVFTVTTPILEELNQKIAKLEDNRVIHIHHADRITILEEQVHCEFETFMKALLTRLPVMLVGPAGTGKTFAAAQAAKSLGVGFHAISVGSQTSKSDIGGYMNAVGSYVTSQFRDAYENGGVFLMDEIDAGNSNVLIFINAALSSDMCAFPDGMVQKHKDFFFVATGNTYGLGANRQYVGRNQIDAATLDRFIVLDWPIDAVLERNLVSETKFGGRWLNVVHKVRAKVEESEYRLVISPRATIKGARLLEAELGFDQVLHSVLLSQTSKDQREKLEQVARQAWGTH